MDFGRVITAMVTPFNQRDEIDFGQAERLIDYLITNGSDALVVNGTTGESPTLSKEEKISFLKFVVNYVNKRVPIIAGTGSNNTTESISLTREAEKIGVDGIMLVTPYYNKPSQEGMYQHFLAIANATTLPVMLYNIPGRSVVNLAVDTVIRLSKVDNIIAIKEASGNLDAIGMIVAQTPADFYLYSGDDNLTLPILALGGHGVVSVSSHIVGREMKQMTDAYLAGEVEKATQIHQDISSIMKTLFIAPNPTAVKEALAMIGLRVGSVRLPLIPLNQSERAILHEALHSLQQHKVS
ncbi:4-hydroxy-tetrahydrodipicolinate synthase [Natronobacillus azotifigens]|uniref:4-hydroxy-tetrahydrodipicolinate synthase n=1 Tax=Natronobacillus azotifigens TaxID=472978 RepID=A0A9J6R9M8_9BACI|nr:4-hydroxy-tetrahydrodipicolinate synthase [Natronobacillus azotifigens]MCZ0701969.1 4-hydroxy-tetrahydrodipicolinate synthase [Natronobacillus azotifigens]